MVDAAKHLISVAVLILLAACAPLPTRVGATYPPPIATATIATCQPSQIQTSKNEFPEIQGTMGSDGEMWALLFFDKLHAKEDLKIVWRITGSGKQFTVQARQDDGTVISPTRGHDLRKKSGRNRW